MQKVSVCATVNHGNGAICQGRNLRLKAKARAVCSFNMLQSK